MINDLTITSSLTLSLPLFRSTPIWMVWSGLCFFCEDDAQYLRVGKKKTRRRRQDCCWESPLSHRLRSELSLIWVVKRRQLGSNWWPLLPPRCWYVVSCSDWGGNSSPWFCLPAALKTAGTFCEDWRLKLKCHQSSESYLVIHRHHRRRRETVMKGGGREGNCDGCD